MFSKMLARFPALIIFFRRIVVFIRHFFGMFYNPFLTFLPAGHFYSAIPSMKDIKRDAGRIFNRRRAELPGIDLRAEEQIKLIEKFGELYGEIPFRPDKQHNLRYYFENDSFRYGDAVMLYSMLRLVQPRKIIEAGSGFSSCLMMDVNRLFFDNKINITCIEPYPKKLYSLLEDEDLNRVEILSERIQDLPLEKFKSLNENDLLFIDSTHVSKVGSDVNHIFFEILPSLNKGVYIHFHDIFYPFEYPHEWYRKGILWNEAYLLRALLQSNKNFEIVIFNSYLDVFHSVIIEKQIPLFLKDAGGSIWLKKIN